MLLKCSPQAIASKIVVDQIVMTPFGSALFYSAAKLMDLQPHAIGPTLKVSQYFFAMFWLIDSPARNLCSPAILKKVVTSKRQDMVSLKDAQQHVTHLFGHDLWFSMSNSRHHCGGMGFVRGAPDKECLVSAGEASSHNEGQPEAVATSACNQFCLHSLLAETSLHQCH